MPAQQIADVNWLLSAITQSAAALIAIVGGLLVSRYVSLHAEQQAARRRADDLLRREGEALTQLMQHQRAYDLYYVDEFLDDSDVFETILREKGQATVEQVLADKDSEGLDLNQELLAEQLSALQDEFAVAVNELLSKVPVEKEHDSWRDFKRGKDFPIGHPGAWEWVYEKLCAEKRAEAKRIEEQARKKGPYGALFAPTFDASDIPRFEIPEIRGLRNVVSTQHEVAHINALRGRVETARAEVLALQQERRLAEELYEASRQPEGFSLALQVLAVLAVLGMGVPVVIMGFAPLTLPVWARVVVVALFFCGVAVLLRFLFVYARYLRGARRSLPSWIGGLLRSDKA